MKIVFLYFMVVSFLLAVVFTYFENFAGMAFFATLAVVFGGTTAILSELEEIKKKLEDK